MALGIEQRQRLLWSTDRSKSPQKDYRAPCSQAFYAAADAGREVVAISHSETSASNVFY